MKKRKIIALALCALLFAFTVPADAQQPKKIARIGYLSAAAPTVDAYSTDAFRQGMRQIGYVEGKDFVIENRSAPLKLDRLNELAAELLRLKVDVIVTRGPPATRAAKAATTPIPWATDSSPAWRDPVETLRAYQTFPLRQAASKWSF